MQIVEAMEGCNHFRFYDRPTGSVESPCEAIRARGLFSWHLQNSTPNFLFREQIIKVIQWEVVKGKCFPNESASYVLVGAQGRVMKDFCFFSFMRPKLVQGDFGLLLLIRYAGNL